jgi:hypothetical protein
MRLLAIFVLTAVLTPLASAQRTGPAHAAATHPHFNSPTASFALGRTAHSSGFRRSSPYTSLPFPLLGDSFLLDDLYSTGYPVASQPPVFLLQPARATSADYPGPPDNNREPPSAQPLMIELQNGRYVRVSSTPADDEALPLTLSPDPQPTKRASRSSNIPAATTQAPAIAAASPAHDLPPAILIFRDGHTEEVRDYTIADAILYARGDYYTDGYWKKKIAISTLNVARTVEANAARNVNFALPTSPNEVITRP